MSRRELREQIFKLLFRIEFNTPDDMPQQLRLFFEQDEKIEDAMQEEITRKYEKIVDSLVEQIYEHYLMMYCRMKGYKSKKNITAEDKFIVQYQYKV